MNGPLVETVMVYFFMPREGKVGYNYTRYVIRTLWYSDHDKTF